MLHLLPKSLSHVPGDSSQGLDEPCPGWHQKLTITGCICAVIPQIDTWLTSYILPGELRDRSGVVVLCGVYDNNGGPLLPLPGIAFTRRRGTDPGYSLSWKPLPS